LSWQDETPGEFYTEIVADVRNKRGVLAELAATISHSAADIEDVKVKDKDGRYSEVSMLVMVRDRKHLAQVLRRIRALETTIRVVRV
jgi:(p)ppGpp synthase/HD superfamily hydrolase